jgi:demethylsterigmatocystin 6-O-methyltransferase
VGPVLQQLPDFLAETNYENITDNSKTALQRAFNTDLPGFIWFPNQTQRFEYFQQVMTVQRAGAVTWLSAFPFKKHLGDFQGNTVFVDIGGGFGLAHVPALDGVEVIPHNFFEPQVIKGMTESKFSSIARQSINLSN